MVAMCTSCRERPGELGWPRLLRSFPGNEQAPTTGSGEGRSIMLTGARERFQGNLQYVKVSRGAACHVTTLGGG